MTSNKVLRDILEYISPDLVDRFYDNAQLLNYIEGYPSDSAIRALQERVKELKATIKEWESGALVLGWRETRATKIKAMGEK